MTAADITRLAHKHGMTAQDQEGGEGLVVLICREHGWVCGDIVPEKYAKAPFGCPWCRKEYLEETAPSRRAVSSEG